MSANDSDRWSAADDLLLTDGGLETTLIYRDGFELPAFAAFPLLRDERGRAALNAYFDSYTEIAARHGCGIVLEAPTWRANPDWGAVLGYDAAEIGEVNRDAVQLVAEQRSRQAPIVVSGCVGPRGDGYVVADAMTGDAARAYHVSQLEAFAAAGADQASALTLTYAAEAIGIARAAEDVGLPVVISFTLETDGRLPDGTSLASAVRQVDEATDAYPMYFMINCAHPQHFESVVATDEAWVERVQGVRANASTMSHAELDAADDLDRGDPADLGERYRHLWQVMPRLRVVGGCCGTDTEHIDAIASALVG